MYMGDNMMKKTIAFLMILVMMLCLASCGGASDGGKEDKEVDISAINEVIFDNDDLQVVFAGAEYSENEQGNHVQYNFRFQLTGKKGDSIYAYIDMYPFSINGVMCNLQDGDYLIFSQSANHKNTDPVNGTVLDIYSVDIKKDTQEAIGQPGRIDCILKYSLNGEDYRYVPLSFQVGKNNQELPDTQNISLELVKGDYYTQDLVKLKNAGDFDAVLVVKYYLGDEDYFMYNSREERFSGPFIRALSLEAGEDITYDMFATFFMFSQYPIDQYNVESTAMHDPEGNLVFAKYEDKLQEWHVELLYCLRKAE